MFEKRFVNLSDMKDIRNNNGIILDIYLEMLRMFKVGEK